MVRPMRPGPVASADRLRDASVEELTAVYGIGGVVAASIVRFFGDEHTRETLHRLVEAGVSAEAPAPGRIGRASRWTIERARPWS